jgi:GTP cyclohydrolase I
MNPSDTLPDITSEALAQRGLPLQWVGMEQLDLPVSIALENGETLQTPAKANVFVSLDDTASKGIHMSRLHALVQKLGRQLCTRETIDHFLTECVESQAGISAHAKIELHFDLLLEKPALLSGEVGYQAYPVSLTGTVISGEFHYELGYTVPYSSTCPCSASLARQLFANAVDEQFEGDVIDKARLLEWMQSESGSVATPHAQRSYAYVKLVTDAPAWPAFDAVIRTIESTIGTPVQTAVKRVDEQEFARLNAQNLMFCEDAARRIKRALEAMPHVVDYWLKVDHQESLHAHNAVAIDRKSKN